MRGFALAAGRGGAVFLAYGLGDDYLYQTFNHTVKVARSADHGASFLYGTADQYSTTDPDDASLVLSDPDIKIGPVGTAHLVYAKGREAILYSTAIRHTALGVPSPSGSTTAWRKRM